MSHHNHDVDESNFHDDKALKTDHDHHTKDYKLAR
jgi:hypothetical protein